MTSSLFITGAGGFLGRRFLDLADLGRFRRVTALVRAEIALPGGVRAVRGDLLEDGDWTRAIEPDTTVLHLAALTGKASRARHLEVNDRGTARLIEATRAAKASRFLLLSSIAVAFQDRPGYPYAEAKEAAERRLRTSGLDALIVRPTMIFGAGSPVLEGLARLATLPVVPLFGGGRNRVQPVAVDDLARLLDRLLDQDFAGRCLTVAGTESMTMRELLRRLARERLGRERPMISWPLAPTRALLRLVEPLLRPLLPLTAGQLASFANDVAPEPGDPCALLLGAAPTEGVDP
ncbi:MAG: NAD(P)H-binding protein [Planctomycetes bacterium]|nr:NAD(P)H-binding protein [Planctomycetota bacterium]